jgi:demethoxyubiquinone hydroxylase (CLK1/Coq7/Cat5 family)
MSTAKKLHKFNIQQNLRALKIDENEHWIEYINEKSKQRVSERQVMSSKKLIRKMMTWSDTCSQKGMLQ